MPARESQERASKRPSPEALLAAASGEHRGKLKIFLGAAPGVGKTYEMLQEGLAKRQDGADVVIGVVETHGRVETESLARELEQVPRRLIEYRGRMLSEMDLDALLQRRPALALVDELAHTNAEGSRHPKRYMDVEELLATGIDVFTTLNIQHIESLNDVVAQITRIRVRETLPDGVLDRADEIELVDITPEDLIQRLREGKVYVRDQAERALKHYFSPGNLTALRELALRRTAQRVDEQMLNYMRVHAISGPWAAGERLLVCVNETPLSAQLVRQARRLADRLKAPWTAIYVQSQRHHRLSEIDRDRIADTLRLAERLGGEALTIPGNRIVDDVLAYAQANNITRILLGKSSRSRWFELIHGSVVHELIRKAGPIGVTVVASEGETLPAKTVRTKAAPEPLDLKAYAISTLTVLVALGLALGLQANLELQNLSMVFLAAVLFSAIRFGLGPSLYASVLSTLAYNFFFLPPLYTFSITDPSNVLALVFFMLVAVLTSNLTARMRRQVLLAQRQIRTTGELYAFSRKVAGIGDLDDLLWAMSHQVALMLKLRVVLLLPEAGGLVVRAGYPPEDSLEPADHGAAVWAFEHNRAAGRGADTLPGAKRLFLPLRTGRGIVGVLGIDRDQPGPLLSPDERRLLDALADQTAVAIERIRLAEDIDETRIRAETERLRAALLTSLSHDLRTPLSSILGAVTSLRSYGPSYDDAAREELLATIQDEAERLNRFVGNLLDITRIESGSMHCKREPVDVAEVAGSAIRRARRMLGRHRVLVKLPPDLPLIEGDPVLLEQVLFNLLDNSAKYTPPQSAITLDGELSDGVMRLRLLDEGPGIPEEDLERVFDKFHRVRASDQRAAGTGLGLAICRGFVEAMGGSIKAANRADVRGAAFTIVLPVRTVPEPAAAAP